MTLKLSRLLFLFLFVRMAGAGVLIETVQIFPVADTSLMEQFPDNNAGKTPTLIAGVNAQGKRNRALMLFPIPASMPPASVVISVTLKMKVVAASTNGPAAPVFSLHRFLTNWNEGVRTGDNGGPGQFDDSTWSQRQFPDIGWGAPGSQAGTDYFATPSASTAISGLGNVSFQSSTLVADMQGWVHDPSSNWGWILMADDESTAASAVRVASREQNLLNAESIVVRFYKFGVPDPPLRILGFTADKNSLTLRFGLYDGGTNILEYSDSPSSTNWNTLTVFPPQTNYSEVLFPLSLHQATQRFFRFRLDTSGQ